MHGDGTGHPVERQSLEHPRQSEAVVAVEVGDADARDLGRTNADEQHLALRPLPAVNQEAVLVVHHHLGGQPSVDGWRRGGGAKKQDFEQRFALSGELRSSDNFDADGTQPAMPAELYLI